MLCSTELCEPGRSLPVLAWLAVPLLFVASVVGLTAAAGSLLGVVGGQLPLPTEVVGAATAVTLALSGRVRSWNPAMRRVLSWAYPLLVLGVGIGLHWLPVPTSVAIGTGIPALVAALALCLWMRSVHVEQPPRLSLAR